MGTLLTELWVLYRVSQVSESDDATLGHFVIIHLHSEDTSSQKHIICPDGANHAVQHATLRIISLHKTTTITNVITTTFIFCLTGLFFGRSEYLDSSRWTWQIFFRVFTVYGHERTCIQTVTALSEWISSPTESLTHGITYPLLSVLLVYPLLVGLLGVLILEKKIWNAIVVNLKGSCC